MAPRCAAAAQKLGGASLVRAAELGGSQTRTIRPVKSSGRPRAQTRSPQIPQFTHPASTAQRGIPLTRPFGPPSPRRRGEGIILGVTSLLLGYSVFHKS